MGRLRELWQRHFGRAEEPASAAMPPPNPYEPQVRAGVDDEAAEGRADAIQAERERRDDPNRPRDGGGTERV